MGTAATTAATDYATAAQGSTADTALQPTNNLSDLNDAGTALDNLGFSAFGKSIIDDADAAAVRTTLGLGEAATADTLGGSQDFTATGTLATGDIVGLRSDGTVEKVTGTSTNYTTSIDTIVTWEYAYETAITFDSNSNKVIIAYRLGGLNQGYAVVGTVSGTSISFGTPVQFTSNTVGFISATFDSNADKVVIAYSDVSDTEKGKVVVGTVSGTSISFGTPALLESSRTDYTSTTFDSFNNKVVIAYRNRDTLSSYAVVGTVSGTSISLGSPVYFSTAMYNSATFDSFNNKVVIAYRLSSNAYGNVIVGTVTGNSISFGTAVEFNNGATSWIAATFDSNIDKVVVAYRDVSNADYGTLAVGTVSGTSISFDTPVVFESAQSDFISSTFDSNSNKVVIAYRDDPTSYGTTAVFQAGGTATNTNAESWIGIADGTSGTVKIIGGVAEGLTGLTTGATYYVNYDGTLTTTENAGPLNGTYGKIGKALSSTQLLITEGNA